MAKRNPAKTARNRAAAVIDAQLKELLAAALHETGRPNELSLNAIIGGKYQDYANVKELCFRTDDELVSAYLDGLLRDVFSRQPHLREGTAAYRLANWYKTSQVVRAYIEAFIKRTFLRHYAALSRVKPTDTDARLWIGQNHQDYGLLVTPRFNKVLGDWENDKSEIRRFPAAYYTIGHVVLTGLVLPGKDRKVIFANIDQYLTFFRETLVRSAGSKHQDAVADRYSDFVRKSPTPDSVPLLIPELRFRGREKLHKYRLDFCVIDPHSLVKIGFELSPWSAHGYLAGTKKKTVAQVNEEASGNFAAQVAKQEAYFRTYGIHTTVFTDQDLLDPDRVFEVISKYLVSEQRGSQLLLTSRHQLLQANLLDDLDLND